MPVFNYGVGTTTVNIPDNAININITIAGGSGGNGGGDAGANPGAGGGGRIERFLLPDFTGRSLTFYVGGRGSNGFGCVASSGSGAGGAGLGGGGRGGFTGPQGCSGGGGGGGGGTFVWDSLAASYIIAVGGGGGGGGASWNASGQSGATAGGLGTVNGGALPPVANGSNINFTGQNGASCPSDGGGGGGGGGGFFAGGGGYEGYDNNRGGGGGSAGGSIRAQNFVTLPLGGSAYNFNADGYAIVEYDLIPADIVSFYATPNPQASSTGTPSYSTSLTWSSTGGTSATLTSSAGETFSIGTNGTLNITNLPQSTAGSNSPATRTYYLTVSNSSNSDSANVTVAVYNDNISSNSWTTSFNNLEPSTQVTLTLGTLAGVDMPTLISTSGEGNFVGTSGSYSGSRYFNNGNSVQLRTTTLPFNTDVSGETGIYGKTNTKTVTITTPSGSFNVNVITRAPRISEVFDYANNVNKYPYEDIDLITNTPTLYLTTGQVDVDDVEIDVEMKVSDPNAEVSINGGTWQNVRSI